MNEMNENLKKYLVAHEKITSKDLFRYGVETILLDELKYDTEYYKIAIKKIVSQKMKNEIFKKEIFKLQDEFNKNDLKIIFIKGLTLAHDLYEKIPERQFNDIDIIIEVNQIGRALKILSNLGFYKVGQKKVNDTREEVAGIRYDEYLQEFGKYRMHFPELEKYSTEKACRIEIDCHVCIFQNLPDYKAVMKKCFDQMEYQIIDGIRIGVLSIYHRLLHLISHFIVDTYQMNMRWIINGWNEAPHYVKLSLLHDIALLYTKYANSIDWKHFIEIAKMFNQEKKVYLVFKILRDVYKINTIEFEVVYEKNKFLDNILKEVSRMKTCEIILKDQYELGECIIKNIINDKNEIVVKRNEKIKCLIKRRDSFEINPCNVDKDGTHGFLYFGEDSMKFIFKKKTNDKINFPEVVIMIGNEKYINDYKCYIPIFRFIINERDNFTAYNGQNEMDNGYHINVCDDGNEITCEITIFDEILPCISGNRFLVNIELQDRDDHGVNIYSYNELKTMYSLSDFKLVKIE